MDQTVSVVIPTYNNAQYIKEALDSVFAQSLAPCQVIVIDDGSTDNTQEVVAKYGIKIIYHRIKNSGQAYARNIGIELVKGKYTAFLDADDIWLPKKLEKQIALIEKNPNCPMVFCNFSVFIEDSSSLDVTADWLSTKKWMATGNIFTNLVMENFILPSATIVRTRYLREVGGFDPELSPREDRDLCLRLAASYPIEGDKTVLVRKRKHRSNSGDNIEKGCQMLYYTMEKMLRLNIPKNDKHAKRLIRAKLAEYAYGLGRLKKSRKYLSICLANCPYMFAISTLRMFILAFKALTFLFLTYLPSSIRRILEGLLSKREPGLKSNGAINQS